MRRILEARQMFSGQGRRDPQPQDKDQDHGAPQLAVTAELPLLTSAKTRL
jgi:hypothetical protein